MNLEKVTNEELQKKISNKEKLIKSKINEEDSLTSKTKKTDFKNEIKRQQTKKQYDFGDNIFMKRLEKSEMKDLGIPCSSSSESESDDDIYKYEFEPSILREYFSFLFTNNNKKKRVFSVGHSKTQQIISRIKKRDRGSPIIL